MKAKLLLVAILLSVSGFLYAEGGTCPHGYYPIGGQGTSGCAPIPDYESDGDQESVGPQTRWVETWGAITIDSTLAKMGASTGNMSKREASKAAIADCYARGGGSGCKDVRVTYRNQCAVVVTGDSGNTTAHAESIEVATRLAMDQCTSSAYANCHVYYSACSEPVQIQ